MTIPVIFQTEGETGFRFRETEALNAGLQRQPICWSVWVCPPPPAGPWS